MNKKNVCIPIQAEYMPSIPGIQHIAEFLEFAKWCSMPSYMRDPKTQKEFSERFKVSQDSLTDWKKHPSFWPLVWQLLAERIKENIPDAIEGIYDKILSGKGSASDLQLLLRIAEGSNNKINKKQNK